MSQVEIPQALIERIEAAAVQQLEYTTANETQAQKDKTAEVFA